MDAITIGVGSAGTVTGVGETIKAWTNDVRIVAVEPYECQALSGGVTGPHNIPDIGFGLVPKNFNSYVVDNVAAVSSRTPSALPSRCCAPMPSRPVQRRGGPARGGQAGGQRHQPLGAGRVQRPTESLINRKGLRIHHDQRYDQRQDHAAAD